MKNLFSIFTSSAFWTVVAGVITASVITSVVLPKVIAKFGK